MSRPGTDVYVLDAIPPTSAPTDTDVAFIVGEAEHGPAEPVQIRSLASFEQAFGDRINPTAVYDTVEACFRDGVNRAYFKRLIPADAAAATVDQDDDDFTVTATEVGAWGNGLTLALMTSAELEQLTRRRVRLVIEGAAPAPRQPAAKPAAAAVSVVVRRGATVLERSAGPVSTVGELIDWSATSAYVRVTGDDATATLATDTLNLAGGTDGTLPVTSAPLLLDACLDIPPELGPGQLLTPGKFTPAQHEAVLKGAEPGNRTALLDANPALDEAGLVAHTQQLRQFDEDRFGGLFAGRAIVPGRAPGTRRTIPWSGIQAGLIARQDATGNPNRAAAGSFGISSWAIDLERTYADDERERLMHAGVNTPRIIYDTVRGYGFRSLVDEQGPRRGWLLLSNVRLAMAVKARGDEIAERYVFEVIDGRGLMFARFGGELSAMVAGYWPDALYGDTPEEAYRVDTGDAVNTPETVANLEVHAVILLRMNPFGEWVEVQIVKQAITESLA
jgi:hypothetical protein